MVLLFHNGEERRRREPYWVVSMNFNGSGHSIGASYGQRVDESILYRFASVGTNIIQAVPIYRHE